MVVSRVQRSIRKIGGVRLFLPFEINAATFQRTNFSANAAQHTSAIVFAPLNGRFIFLPIFSNGVPARRERREPGLGVSGVLWCRIRCR